MKRLLIRLLVLSGIFFLVPQYLVSQIKMVSGLEQEVYNQFALDISNNTNANLKIYPTYGSVDNFNYLLSDSIQMGFMQYDVLLYKELENPGISDYIKIFVPLYYEEIHLIARNNSRINSLSDLAGKRVAIGSEKQGTHVTANYIKLKTELKWQNYNLAYDQAIKALLADSIDAFFFVGAVPANALKSLSAATGNIIKLVPLVDKRLNPFYQKRVIKAGTYPWAKYDVETFAVRSLIVVNTKNLSPRMQSEVDVLYHDLKDNLKGIQKNKYSHPKWMQVDFSDLDNIDWPVFNKEYVLPVVVFNYLAYIAVILTFFQIYFMLNKLWKRKHEKVVAESISISGLFISILINSFFAFKNIINDGIPQLVANGMWIINSIITILIGVGFWVVGSRQKGFWHLLLQALKLERAEAGDLAKAFFRPSGADKIIEILGQVAMIDDELAEKEKDFIDQFAREWHIAIDWDYVKRNFGSKSGAGFHTLRKSMMDYLATMPPQAQVSQLNDVLNMLINADEQVTPEEELIMSELSGLIAGYLSGDGSVPYYQVAVVPQNPEQEAAIKTLMKDLTRKEIAGGYAYLSEPFYSERYAEIVCERYRTVNVFTVVIKPNQILDSHVFAESFLKD